MNLKLGSNMINLYFVKSLVNKIIKWLNLKLGFPHMSYSRIWICHMTKPIHKYANWFDDEGFWLYWVLLFSFEFRYMVR